LIGVGGAKWAAKRRKTSNLGELAVGNKETIRVGNPKSHDDWANPRMDIEPGRHKIIGNPMKENSN
jgi:hypothetical protein